MTRLHQPRRLFYGWVVLGITVLGLVAAQGDRGTFGVFVPAWQEAFQTDRASIALAASVGFVFYGLTLPLVGALTDRLGPRVVYAGSILIIGVSLMLTAFATSLLHLYILYGLLASVGFAGASNVTAAVIVARWFVARRGLALGIVTMGMGLGRFLVVPGTILIIQQLGWQRTIFLLGLMLVAFIFPLVALIMRSGPVEGEPAASSRLAASPDPSRAPAPPEAPYPLRQAMRTRSFWFLTVPYFICGYTTAGLVGTHLVPFAYDQRIPEAATAFAMAVLAGFNIGGSFCSGYLSDRWGATKVLAFLYGTRSLSYLFLALAPGTPLTLVVFAILFGLVDFATIPPVSALTTTYFGRGSLGVILGSISLAHQMGSAAGAYIPGLLFDRTASYRLAFLSAAAFLVIAAALSVALPERLAPWKAVPRAEPVPTGPNTAGPQFP